MREPMSDLDRLVEDLEVYAEGCDCDICRMCLNAAATITRLREALEPFAEDAVALPDGRAFLECGPGKAISLNVTADHFRRARQALGGEHG